MTIIVGSGGSYTWDDNFGNEDHEHDGDDLTIPVVLEETLGDEEKYFECKNAGATQSKLIIWGDGGFASSGECHTYGDLFSDTIIVDNGIELQKDAALIFKPYDENDVPIPNRVYQFGRNPNIGSLDHEGDGLFLKGPFTDPKDCTFQLKDSRTVESFSL